MEAVWIGWRQRGRGRGTLHTNTHRHTCGKAGDREKWEWAGRRKGEKVTESRRVTARNCVKKRRWGAGKTKKNEKIGDEKLLVAKYLAKRRKLQSWSAKGGSLTRCKQKVSWWDGVLEENSFWRKLETAADASRFRKLVNMTDVADTFTHSYTRKRSLPAVCEHRCHVLAMNSLLRHNFFFIALYQGRGWPAKWCCWLSSRRDQGDPTSGWPEIFEEAIQSPFYSVTTQWVSPIRDQLQPLLSHRWKACSKKACTVCTWPTCMYSQVDPRKGMNMQQPTTPQHYRTLITLSALTTEGSIMLFAVSVHLVLLNPMRHGKPFFFFFSNLPQKAAGLQRFHVLSLIRRLKKKTSIQNCFQP